jgi:uncharacterized protein (TIGR03067 family)
MTANTLWTLTAALALAAPAAEVKKDEDRLQGEWKVQSLENAGKKAEPKEFANWKLIVSGDKMKALDGKDVMDEYSFRLDPAAKPPAIDMTILAGESKDKTLVGIYRLEGDTLTVCVSEPGKRDRPKEFRTTEKESHLLLVFQRLKP